MPRPARHPRIGSLIIGLLLLGLGLYLSLMAVAEMLMNAVYLRESSTVIAVVEDVRQKPFGSISAAFDHGYISWGSNTSYQPIVSFTLTDNSRARMPLPDLSDRDYKRGDSLEVRVPRDDWRKSREYRARFFWGAPCLSLLLGLICAWCGKTQLSIRSRRLRAERSSRSSASPRTTRPRTTSPQGRPTETPRPAPTAREERDTRPPATDTAHTAAPDKQRNTSRSATRNSDTNTRKSTAKSSVTGSSTGSTAKGEKSAANKSRAKNGSTTKSPQKSETDSNNAKTSREPGKRGSSRRRKDSGSESAAGKTSSPKRRRSKSADAAEQDT